MAQKPFNDAVDEDGADDEIRVISMSVGGMNDGEVHLHGRDSVACPDQAAKMASKLIEVIERTSLEQSVFASERYK